MKTRQSNDRIYRVSPDEEDMEDRCGRGGLFSFLFLVIVMSSIGNRFYLNWLGLDRRMATPNKSKYL